MKKLQSFAEALHQDLDPFDDSPEGKVYGQPSEIELVLVQHQAGWDLSALHKNAGVLSTLIPATNAGQINLVLVNGHNALAPQSGMQRRRAKS